MAKLLVVEDDLYLRKLMSQALTDQGHTLSVAGDGREALAQLARSVPDLLITDVIMPEMDGFELIMKVRKTYPSLRVLAISAGGRNSSSTYLDISRTIGADRVLGKPFDLPDLFAMVNELVPPAPAAG
jgi:CheY-like chemotaxis protein